MTGTFLTVRLFVLRLTELDYRRRLHRHRKNVQECREPRAQSCTAA